MDKLSSYSTSTNNIKAIDNIIKLKLKKPNTWNWELSTSKSSPNLSFPTIQLFNDKGLLLAEAKESANICINHQSKQHQIKNFSKVNSKDSIAKLSEISENIYDLIDYKNLPCNVVTKVINKEFNEIEKRNKTGKFSINDKINSINKFTQSIETSETPTWVNSSKNFSPRNITSQEFNNFQRRYEKSKSFNFKKSALEHYVHLNTNERNLKDVCFDIKKFEGKSKCSETNETPSPSIFSKSTKELMVVSNLRSSTERHDVQKTELTLGPKYFLRTSNAGTLVVCEDNFSNRTSRHRYRDNSKSLNYDNKFDIENKISYNLKQKVSVMEKTNLQNLLKDKEIDIAIKKVVVKNIVESQYKNRKNLTSDRKLKLIRKFVSVGNICLSSDEEQKPKKEIKLRKKRKVQPIKHLKRNFLFSNYGLWAKNGSRIIGSFGDGSNFKINQDKLDNQLPRLLTIANFDPGCDQGYGSEKSPENELPPLNLSELNKDEHQPENLNILWNTGYDFVTEDCIFSVPIEKGSLGFGFSIAGGIDKNIPFHSLIRIKNLFPHQAAWNTGKLKPGDIILETNGISLVGLKNYEALDVLRNMPKNVTLLMCRTLDEKYKKPSATTRLLKPSQNHHKDIQKLSEQKDAVFPSQQLGNPLIQANFSGEFEIYMIKQQGSLGFTLKKDEECVLGHYVNELVREPATMDGRINAGDKILAVNDVSISSMSHEQAVIFLRQSRDLVKLLLYRSEVQIPITKNFVSGKKVVLRPEALNLLNDLANKKHNSQDDSTVSTVSSNISTNSYPKKLKRGLKSQSLQSKLFTDSKSSSNAISSETTAIF